MDKFDIETMALPSGRPYDVAACLEVAEHVREAYADKLVDLLAGLSRRFVFAAATPGQDGGVDHVNEQPNAYWIGKFVRHGFRYDEAATMHERTSLAGAGAAGFYAGNLMLFAKP